MTVQELINLLQSLPKDMLVAQPMYSEYNLLSEDAVGIQRLCEARSDGWVANERGDKALIEYVVIGI